MPELPEVETIKNNLNSYLANSRLNNIVFRRTDIIGSKDFNVPYYDFNGLELLGVERHGKYILFHFTDNHFMIIHLRMTGKLIFLPALSIAERLEQLNHKHTHAILDFSNGILIYNDVRRFGKFYFSNPIDNFSIEDLLKSGPDALSPSFTSEYLYSKCQKHKKKPVKNIILDQQIVAGIGNIYADESLFLARIMPNRLGSNISEKEANKLHKVIFDILNSSIAKGGTTFSDYRHADNKRGSFQDSLLVYGRSGEKCINCNGTLETIKIAGRTSVFCPNCQL